MLAAALIALSGCGRGGSELVSVHAASRTPKEKSAEKPAEKTSCEGGPIVVYYCGPETIHLLGPRR
jgi:hypothetical protein